MCAVHWQHTHPVPPQTYKKIDRLVNLVERYENQHSRPGLSDALSAIISRMDKAGLSKKDLQSCFGSYQKTLDVLSGKRELTLSMARSLHENFQVPAEVLLGEPNKNFNPIVNPDELKHFPWNEILKREWVTRLPNWKDRFEEMFIELARLEQNLPTPSPALLRETGKYRIHSQPNHYAVRAWCMRVANVASDNPAKGTYQPKSETSDFMREVAILSVHEDGPLRAQKHLSENGINLVVERHLPKTYLDGAAFLLSDGQPVIGLTLRHDRLDNFWFTLMHELAHVKLHLDNNIGELFVDELKFSAADLDTLERDADEYATESLIPSKLWESSDARLSLHPSDAYQLAHSANIHPAIVVGRIRYEKQQLYQPVRTRRTRRGQKTVRNSDSVTKQSLSRHPKQ